MTGSNAERIDPCLTVLSCAFKPATKRCKTPGGMCCNSDLKPLGEFQSRDFGRETKIERDKLTWPRRFVSSASL